eukprot:Gregarina_sp_Poly_1__10503@NODE_76_length_15862_cov_98_864577_g65_i0_p2_GENE_NODE_76_length_15862_cov_98_864577_g65_i0NODE_76_length_15862_cov_98_864577_g65_i0_p2_ORF_typecomplete_len583_score108_87DUF2207/PF09972_9/7_2e02DUF2207/PF09972_9/0_0048DUF3040/PF11239_8/0_023DUF3040/PF11239_8/2_2e03Mucin/PF01456_17/0_67Mucin/PF01456_17/1_5e03_NODE_76_length_15862_cov_98_864577_g65_i0945111199
MMRHLLGLFCVIPGLQGAALKEDCADTDVLVYALKDGSLPPAYDNFVASMASWGNKSGFNDTKTEPVRKMGVASFNDKEQPGLEAKDARCFEEIFPLGSSENIEVSKVPSNLPKGDAAQDSWSAIAIALQSDIIPSDYDNAAKVLVLITDSLPHTYNSELPQNVSHIPEVEGGEDFTSSDEEEAGIFTSEEETEAAGAGESEAAEETTTEETTTIDETSEEAGESSEAALRSRRRLGARNDSTTTTTTTPFSPFPDNENVNVEFKVPKEIKDIKCDQKQGYPKLSTVIDLLNKTGTHLLILSPNMAWKEMANAMPFTSFEELTLKSLLSTDPKFPDSLDHKSQDACKAIAAMASSRPERKFKWWHALIIVLGVTALAILFAGIWELCGLGRKGEFREEAHPRIPSGPEGASLGAAGIGGAAAGGAGAAGVALGGEHTPSIPGVPEAGAQPGAPGLQPGEPGAVPVAGGPTELPGAGGMASPTGEVPQLGGALEAGGLASPTGAAGHIAGGPAGGQPSVVSSPEVVVPPPTDKKGSTESATATQGVGTAQGHARDDKTITVANVEHVETRGGISALKEKFTTK